MREVKRGVVRRKWALGLGLVLLALGALALRSDAAGASVGGVSSAVVDLPPRCSSAASTLGRWWASAPSERPAMVALFTGAQEGTISFPGEGASANELAAYTFGVCYRDPALQAELYAGFLAAALAPPVVPGATFLARSLGWNGITVTFATDATVATYANGDWAVVAPWPAIVAVNPPSVTSGGRTMHGAEINPKVDGVQGYDSAAFGQWAPGRFSPALNVARSMPLQITAPASVVFTRSVAAANSRPQLDGAFVLTFVDQAPPAGAFRPPYCGTNKAPVVREADGAWKLQGGMPSAGRPVLAALVAKTDGPYVGEEFPDFLKRYLHAPPMDDYGAEISATLGEAWLAASDADLTDEQRAPLTANLVQIGIDWHGVFLQAKADHWNTGGGHAEGVGEAIILAGAWLGNDAMMSIRTSRPAVLWNLWAQTYRVPASYVGGSGGYQAAHVGLPEWGNEHAKNLASGAPNTDDVRWDISGILQPLVPIPANATPQQRLALEAQNAAISLENEKINSVKVYRAAVCLPSRTGNVLALWIQGVDGKVFPSDPTLVVDLQRRWRWEANRRGETGQRLDYFHRWSRSCWDAIGPRSETTYPSVP